MEDKPVFTAHVEGDPSSQTVDEVVRMNKDSDSRLTLFLIITVLLVVLGILGTIFIPLVLKKQTSSSATTSQPVQQNKKSQTDIEKEHDAQRKSDVALILKATQLYYAERQRFPSSLQELSGAGVMKLGLDKSGGKDIPVDPKTGELYEYEVWDDGQNCLIRTILSSDELYELSCAQ